MPNFWVRITGAMCAVAVLVGCAGVRSAAQPTVPGGPDDDRPVVLSTFTVLADLVREVGGPHIHAVSLMPVGTEVHGYEPTPDDIRRALQADLVIDNGLNLEARTARLLEEVHAPRVTASDGVETVAITGGGSDGAANPHAWMSPLAAQTYVDNIETALLDLVPEHAADIRARADRLRAELVALHDEMRAQLATVPSRQRALVTCEGAFSYLARDLGLKEAWLWPVNSDQQGTPRQVARVVDFVRENAVPAVFCESTVPPTAQRTVAEETGARFGGVLYVDSLSGPDGPVPTYRALLRHTTSTIVRGLTGS